jgi:hypothetical protein
MDPVVDRRRQLQSVCPKPMFPVGRNAGHVD